MGYATASDGVRLYYEEAGTGTPIIFVHEFAGDHRAWEPQVSFFSRRHRCIVYAARGYPPSDVPENFESYSQRIATTDIVAVLNSLSIHKAHVVGLSMGGLATLHLGLVAPDRAMSLTVAGAGYGADKSREDYFRNLSRDVAKQFETLGSKAFAEIYALSASRVQFQNKDPRGWRLFVNQLAEHSALGSANTMRGVQARRPSVFDLAPELARMAVPTLIMTGDEDDHCLQPGLFLKRTIPAAGLVIFPKTGHTLNLEEPALFNQFVAEFIAMVEAGRWLNRDPRANPAEIMKAL